MQKILNLWLVLLTGILVSILFETIMSFSGPIDLIRIIVYTVTLGLTLIVFEHIRMNRKNKQVKRAENIFKRHLIRKNKIIDNLREEKQFLLRSAVKRSEIDNINKSFKNPDAMKEAEVDNHAKRE